MSTDASEDPELLALIERFETAWEGTAPPDLEAFVVANANEQPDGEAFRRRLLLELVPIDLEHRWRHQGNSSEATVSGIGNLASEFPRLPKLEDYFTRFPQLGTTDAIPLELIVDEFRTRHFWGDRPSVDAYQSRFEHVRGLLSRELATVLAECAPLTLTVYCQQKAVYKCLFEKPLEVGRQCTGEPLPYDEVTTDSVSRLIIAPRQDKYVSRHHLFLERVKQDVVQVTSRTTKGDILLGSHRLPPRQIAKVGLPILLVLGGCVIRLELL